MKSSDYIGITNIVVTPDMIGKQLAIFTAIEIKDPDWKYAATKREVAQKKFIDLIIKSGGIATFANCVDDYRKAVLNFTNAQE